MLTDLVLSLMSDVDQKIAITWSQTLDVFADGACRNLNLSQLLLLILLFLVLFVILLSIGVCWVIWIFTLRWVMILADLILDSVQVFIHLAWEPFCLLNQGSFVFFSFVVSWCRNTTLLTIRRCWQQIYRVQPVDIFLLSANNFGDLNNIHVI